MIGYFVQRYLDAPVPPVEVRNAEVERDLGLSEFQVRKVRRLLMSSNIPMAGGGGSDEAWRWDIDDQILVFRGMSKIDQIIRRLYPPKRTQLAPTPADAAQGTLDWTIPIAGWNRVETRLASLRTKLTAAETTDDWQDIGRRCREIVIDAANVVFSPALLAAGTAIPGKSDAKARLDLYFEAVVPELSDDLRAFVTGTWRLANALTHQSRMGRVEGVSTVQGVILLVRVLQELGTLPRRRRHSAGTGAQRAAASGSD